MLGKTFYKSGAKRPIPVVVSAKPQKVDGKRVKKDRRNEAAVAARTGTPENIAVELERAAGAATLNFSQSAELTVRAGSAGFTPDQLAANVDVLARAIVDKHVPERWRNVRALYLRGPDTASLPIWQTDELWLDEKDVVPDTMAIEGGSSAAGGKKRKIKDEQAEGSPASKKSKKDDKTQGAWLGEKAIMESPAAKKPKEAKKSAMGSKYQNSDDTVLNKQISERKAKLKKQKAAAALNDA